MPAQGLEPGVNHRCHWIATAEHSTALLVCSMHLREIQTGEGPKEALGLLMRGDVRHSLCEEAQVLYPARSQSRCRKPVGSTCKLDP